MYKHFNLLCSALFLNISQSDIYFFEYFFLGSEAETESDSDNCSPQKMASALMGDEDFDYIAKVLFHHPTIQAVMGAQDI